MRRWTPEERAKQAELIRVHKPWAYSTGARTQQGKKQVAKNALVHGLDSLETKHFMKLIKEHRRLLKEILRSLGI